MAQTGNSTEGYAGFDLCRSFGRSVWWAYCAPHGTVTPLRQPCARLAPASSLAGSPCAGRQDRAAGQRVAGSVLCSRWWGKPRATGAGPSSRNTSAARCASIVGMVGENTPRQQFAAHEVLKRIGDELLLRRLRKAAGLKLFGQPFHFHLKPFRHLCSKLLHRLTALVLPGEALRGPDCLPIVD
jgi:hypothetical protein